MHKNACFFVSSICDTIDIFATGGLFCTVGDQNGEFFLACSLDLETFWVLFSSLSSLMCLKHQLNPSAYNYMATADKIKAKIVAFV